MEGTALHVHPHSRISPPKEDFKMAQVERVREEWHGGPLDEEIRRKAQAGWRPVAVVWEREADSKQFQREVDVPYGLKVAADAHHL
jgi:hypothetical protein